MPLCASVLCLDAVAPARFARGRSSRSVRLGLLNGHYRQEPGSPRAAVSAQWLLAEVLVAILLRRVVPAFVVPKQLAAFERHPIEVRELAHSSVRDPARQM
jgi:hypothetical protein